MLNNLFSSFDEKNFLFSLVFINIIFFLLMMNNNFKLSTFNTLKIKINLFLNNFISLINIFKLMFALIFFLNMMSLNFFSFSATSHMSFNMPLIIMLWAPLLLMSLTKLNNKFLCHLLPLNTPLMLIPIMILIEFMSFMIRPLTLFLRLSINMIAGHVLINLMSEWMMNKKFVVFFPLMFIYMMLKYMVSFIQSYIVITLIYMYKEELYVN